MKFVKISDNLEMATTQVTQKTWKKIMDDDPSYFKGDNLPVEQISFYDCEEFIEKLNIKSKRFIYRLPTEQEWENAAKSCDKQEVQKAAWFYQNSNNKTHPVGTKDPNELGIYDMLGNVWEWTSTESGSVRVIRGGGWYDFAQGLRSAGRNYVVPGYRSISVGFRLVRTPKLQSTLLPFDTKNRDALEVALKALRDIRKILNK